MERIQKSSGFLSWKKKLFCWNLVDLQCCVNFTRFSKVESGQVPGAQPGECVSVPCGLGVAVGGVTGHAYLCEAWSPYMDWVQQNLGRLRASAVKESQRNLGGTGAVSWACRGPLIMSAAERAWRQVNTDTEGHGKVCRKQGPGETAEWEMLKYLSSVNILSHTWYFLPGKLDVTNCSHKIVERIKCSFQKASPGHRDVYR